MRLGINLTAQNSLRTGDGKPSDLLTQCVFSTLRFLADLSVRGRH